MKKIKETYYCDRCGKEMNRQKNIYEIFGPRVLVQVNRADEWMSADLCDDCQKAFKAWWKMTEIKYYWLNDTLEYEDIRKAFQIVVTENVAVELKWFVPHSGYYTALISPEDVMKMSPRELYIECKEALYGND